MVLIIYILISSIIKFISQSNPQINNLNQKKQQQQKNPSNMIKTIIIFIFIIFFIGIAQTTGPLVNMLLMMSMNYDAKVSISLTFLFLAGGSIGTMWKNSQRINPKTGKTFIKLDLILLTLPCQLSGTLFGGVFRNFFSEIMITFLFIFLFLFLIYDLCKVLKQKKQHPNQIKDDVFIELQQMNKPLVPNQSKQPIVIDQSRGFIQYSNKPSSKSKLKQVIILCICYFVFTVLTSLVRGGPKYASWIGINPCGGWGWLIMFSHLSISIILSVLTVRRILGETKGLTDEQIRKYSIQVTQKNVWYFLIAGFVGGFFGALMAIGATLILIPVWLKMGVDKDYAGASPATLIFLASLVAFSVAYFNHVLDEIPHYMLLFYFGLAFVSSAIVRDILAAITRKFKLESLVIILLLFVVICTLVALVPFQIQRLIKDYKKIVELGQLC